MKMKTRTHNLLALLLLMIITSSLMIGCTQNEDNRNYTLGKGEVVSGPLLIWEQNATLEEGSSVGGSVIMFCCNLIVNGSVDGSVYLVSGNLRVDSHADITGDITVISGNLMK
jgi:hypothetical protein